jgi:hypothetical protein
MPGERLSMRSNLHAGFTRACFYEPLVNRTYAEMAPHYGARRGRRSRATEQKLRSAFRSCSAGSWRFISLAELNQPIRELIDRLNDRPMRGWGTTRRALYEHIDRPALRELPPASYGYADWKRCRVNLDYHVGNSVPASARRGRSRITRRLAMPLWTASCTPH